MNGTCPCKGCEAPTRYVGCHSECKKYVDWSAENERQRKNKYQYYRSHTKRETEFMLRKIWK